ncbi:MAG: hypothetical protein EBX52_11985, partial [Proteobacteria bacterium]|nr:hypothetical protein [Pseudomonadota bacterium]
VQTGGFNTEIGQNLVSQYQMQAKAEVVGIAASFVPGGARIVGKGLTSVAVKTGVAESVQLSKATLMTAVKTAPAWKTTVKLLAPAEQFLAKAKAGSVVTLGEMQLALATKVGPKTNQIMVQTFNSFTKEMAEDVALTFGTHALTHPDPYSEEGLLDCLESIAVSRGIAAIGKGAGAYLSAKRPNWKLSPMPERKVASTELPPRSNGIQSQGMGGRVLSSGATTADLSVPGRVEKGLKTTETASLSPVMQDALKLPPENLGYKDYFDFNGRIAKSSDPRKTRLLEVQKSAFDDFSNQVFSKFNKPGERDAFLKKMHSAHETCCVDLGTLKPYGDKVKALQELKNELIAKGFKKDEAFKLIDGISNKDVMILGNPGSNLEDLAKMTNPKDIQTWINGADPAGIEGELKDLIAQRNDVRTRYLAGDAKLQKEYKDLDAKVRGLEANYLLQKKLGTKSEDWKEMFKAKSTNPAPQVAPKVDPQVQAYSKTVDQSIETLKDYDKKFSGSGMQDDLVELGKRPPSSGLKSDLEQRIAEREAALLELETMKKAHAGKFSSSGLPGARDAEAAIEIRARSLRENLEKLKAEKKSVESSILNANERINGISTGDYRDYALKNRLEGEKPYDPNFNKKVQEQIEELKRLKANFKSEDLPALKKVDVDAEIKRLEEGKWADELTISILTAYRDGELVEKNQWISVKDRLP